MRYIEAPETYDGPDPSLFLAGGITGCADWQAEAVKMLRGSALTLFNPRRSSFPMDDPLAAEVQIQWEYDHLRKASAILFWFPPETLCPITLYELGAWSMTDKPIFVGVHPNYPRQQDVELQTKLVRPAVRVVYSLSDLVAQVLSALQPPLS